MFALYLESESMSGYLKGTKVNEKYTDDIMVVQPKIVPILVADPSKAKQYKRVESAIKAMDNLVSRLKYVQCRPVMSYKYLHVQPYNIRVVDLDQNIAVSTVSSYKSRLNFY